MGIQFVYFFGQSYVVKQLACIDANMYGSKYLLCLRNCKGQQEKGKEQAVVRYNGRVNTQIERKTESESPFDLYIVYFILFDTNRSW